MQPSIFNNRVPLGDDSVFLMNTFTDAQLVVSSDVAALLDRLERSNPRSDAGTSLSETERTAISTLAEHGFVVESRSTERNELERFFREHRESTDEMHLTVLTTLQCNFACPYCIQGDHDEYNASVDRMSMDTAHQVCDWLERRLDELSPRRLVLMFFGGEPLLNLDVLYEVAERAWEATQARGIELEINGITNGLLLTPEVVDRLTPFGLKGFKVTLDGDRDTHNRMRPLRGGQGTFDKIIENIRRVADKCHIAIGGNFDADSVDSYPALLDFLKEQSFADSLAKVAFKPIISTEPKTQSNDLIPLTAVDENGKPLGGGCMSSAGSGGGSACDSCNLMDDKLSFLREETKRRGFPTLDGLHMGPCEIHMQHAYTIGIDGSLFACPGFAAERGESVGHIDADRHSQPQRAASAARFDVLAPWRGCGDCSFIPVCAGGCSVSSYNEQGDMNAPACHKSSFEAALVSMAHEYEATVHSNTQESNL